MVDDERLFVTDDSSIHKKQRLDPSDMEILEEVKTGEGLITISAEELKKLAEAAANTFKECQEMVEPMTKEQAEVVRKLRVEEGYSWRAIAHHMPAMTLAGVIGRHHQIRLSVWPSVKEQLSSLVKIINKNHGIRNR